MSPDDEGEARHNDRELDNGAGDYGNPGEDALLVTPSNFGMVDSGIYRSGFPTPANFRFMEELGIQSIVKEAAGTCVWNLTRRLMRNLFKPMGSVYSNLGSKETRQLQESYESISEEAILGALRVLLDVRNHPILIH